MRYVASFRANFLSRPDLLLQADAVSAYWDAIKSQRELFLRPEKRSRPRFLLHPTAPTRAVPPPQPRPRAAPGTPPHSPSLDTQLSPYIRQTPTRATDTPRPSPPPNPDPMALADADTDCPTPAVRHPLEPDTPRRPQPQPPSPHPPQEPPPTRTTAPNHSNPTSRIQSRPERRLPF